MSHDLESRLRAAFRPLEPPQSLDARLAQIKLPPPHRAPHRAQHWWIAAGLAASLLVALGVERHLHQEEELRRGLEARREVMQALRVTSEKLDLAYEAARQPGV